MTQLQTVHFDSIAALRAAADQWDALWRRSDVTLPTLRAELISQWAEQFASSARFHAVAIESAGRLVAALPLVERKLGGLLTVAAMPSNEWSASGELLLDGDASDAVLDALATALGEADLPLLWLDEAALDAPRWQRLAQALLRARMTVAEHRRWEVGQVKIAGDWSTYRAAWSRKHRQKMAWAARKLAQRGDVRLVIHSRLAPDEVAASMQRAFEIEDHSWKGTASSSVLRTPGMADFFIRQARQAARWGQLDLVFLQCGERLTAFSYGLTAKGVFHSLKVGYDREFAEQIPGQLLRCLLLERFFTEPERKALDFQGPMTAAHAAWLPERYAVGRLAAAHSMVGRLAVQAYKNLWLRVRR